MSEIILAILEAILNFFTEDLVEVFDMLFDYIFGDFYHVICSLGDSFINKLLDIYEYNDVSEFFSEDLLYFVIGLPLFFIFLRMILNFFKPSSS